MSNSDTADSSRGETDALESAIHSMVSQRASLNSGYDCRGFRLRHRHHGPRHCAIRKGNYRVGCYARYAYEANTLAAADGLTNIQFRKCAIESLDPASVACDLAITRFSLHHVVMPTAFARKMSEAVKPGGHVAIVDMLSPPDQHLADKYNHYERLRDPSHVRALTLDELQTTVFEAGLSLIHDEAVEIEVSVERWLNLTKASEAVSNQIIVALESEISDGEGTTGMRPFKSAAGELMFRQTWGLVVAQKIVRR